MARPRSLFLQLSAIGAAALVPLLLLLLAIVAFFARDQRSNIEHALQTAAVAAGTAVENYNANELSQLSALAASLALSGADTARLRDMLEAWLDQHPHALSLTLLLYDGKLVASATRSRALPPGDDALRQRVLESGEPVISDVASGERGAVVTLAVPVAHRHAPGDVLVARIGAAAWQNVVARLRVPAGSLGAIVDGRGVVLARTRNSERFVGQPADAEYLRQARSAREGVAHARSLEGEPMALGFHRSGATGWIVSLATPQSLLDAPLRRLFGQVLLAALTAGAVAYLLRRALVKRLQRAVRSLADGARALGRGEAPALAPSGVTELDQVVDGMNQAAAERLAAQQAERRQTERLAQLHTIERAILRAESVEHIAQTAVERLRELIKAPRASVVMFDFDSAEGVVIAYDGETGVPKIGARYALSLYGDLEALRRGGVHRIDLRGQGHEEFVRSIIELGTASLVAVPLRGREGLMGAVTFGLPPDAEPDSADVAVALEVADQLAVAFVQARLRERLASYAAELEQRVEERTAQLVSANADLESYAYVVSHDLREPIRALLGFSTAIREDYGAQMPQDAQRYLERIRAAASRMDRLTQDLLDFSRLGRAALGVEPVALDGVVDEALAGVDIPAGARVDVDARLPRVMAHRGTLVQMVRNLLQNAVKFVAPGSLPRVHVCAKAAGAMTRLVVADQGIGIAPADQARVFRPFERLHASESYAGTGIGLAIVARGAEKMGGAAGVESAPGHGSRFWIELRTAAAGTQPDGTSRTSMTEREHG